jgi:predicted nucleotidyltransferase
MNEEQLNKLIHLAQRYNVTKLIQFGSSINTLEEPNDIDLACDGLYDKNFFKFGVNIEKIFNKPVDLIPLKPESEFTDYINKNGRVLYESKTY